MQGSATIMIKNQGGLLSLLSEKELKPSFNDGSIKKEYGNPFIQWYTSALTDYLVCSITFMILSSVSFLATVPFTTSFFPFPPNSKDKKKQ
jgi:hypothetical protein